MKSKDKESPRGKEMRGGGGRISSPLESAPIKILRRRDSLADNYTRMKEREMDLATGKELSNAAGKIINSLKVELEYNQLMDIKERIDFLEKHTETRG